MNRMEAIGEYTTLECDVIITDGTIKSIDDPNDKIYPVHYDHTYHGIGRTITPYRRKIRVLEEYDALKAEILANEPDMTPEELKKKFVTYGFTAEELSEIGETQKWLVTGGANGNHQ
jgi:hypothetical protein